MDQAVVSVQANGLTFACLEEGTGPLVLMVHGFPDTADSWNGIRASVARAGFRVVCPFTRGYWPTEIPPDGRYDTETLGRDLLALITALGEQSAILVGHDWGAAASYAAAQIDPARVRFLVTVGIPHPMSIRPTPRIVWGARHFVRFKLAGALELLQRDDYAHVDTLVRRWSPTWDIKDEDTRAVKNAFRHDGCADAALDYYRVWTPFVGELLRRKISVPTVSFAGTDDPAITPATYDQARRFYTSTYEVVKMPGAHFMHREHPEVFTRALLAALEKL